MNKIRTIVLVILIVILLLACTRNSDTDVAQARDALREYFNALYAGDHERVIELYGGSYELLQEWNPAVPVDDHDLLFWYACNVNGLVCLPVKDIISEAFDGEKFTFTVEFLTKSGDVFVLGPCCGASEEDEPSQTQFKFTVRKAGDNYLVEELPVYTP